MMRLGSLLGISAADECGNGLSLPAAMNLLQAERKTPEPVKHDDPLAPFIAEQAAHNRQVREDFDQVLLAKAQDRQNAERAHRLHQAREELRNDTERQ
jgi:hypothetical protein